MKRTIIFLLASILCHVINAQDSIVVYQGTNAQKFHLSDVDSITHTGVNMVSVYHDTQKTNYAVQDVDSITLMKPGMNEVEDIIITTVIDWNAIHVAKGGYKLLSMQEEIALPEGIDRVQTQMVRCDRPQVMMLLNANGDIVMMSKGVYENGDVCYMNANSTAIALVMMHPMFGYVPSADFPGLVQIITASPYFDDLVSEVSKSIAQGKSLFETNDDLLNAFSTLLEDLTSFEGEHSDGVLDILYAPRNASVNIADLTNIGPFKMYTEGNKLMIHTGFVTPYYEGMVMWTTNSEKLDIPSGEKMGVFSLLSHPFSQTPDVTFDFNGRPEGEYFFVFSRTTTRANLDFVAHVIGDVLDIVGLPLSKMQLNGLVDDIIVYGSYYTNELLCADDPQQVLEIAFDMVVNYLGSEHFAQFIADSAKLVAVKALISKFSVVLSWYQAIRGSANTITRIVLRMNSPSDFYFTLCYYNREVSSCSEVRLEKSGGDNQVGYKGETLVKPLEVMVFTYDDDGTWIEDRNNYYRVKYSVESGGGSLSWEDTNTTNGEAMTYWRLGDDDGEQRVKAVVVNIATGEEISNPVYFTADVTEKTNITFRLDWDRTLSKTDIDLHVQCPKGHHIYYHNMSCPCGGQLDWDDTHGPGPEHIVFNNAEPGEYLVYVHHYDSESQATIGYSLTTKANEQTYRNVGSVPYHAYSRKYKLTVPQPTLNNGRRRSPKITLEEIEDTDNSIMPELPRKK